MITKGAENLCDLIRSDYLAREMKARLEVVSNSHGGAGRMLARHREH